MNALIIRRFEPSTTPEPGNQSFASDQQAQRHNLKGIKANGRGKKLESHKPQVAA